ncbi:MAG: hypothetical protein HZC12_09880 [Nitrospirae bacterium]|nr:hypothetical protein [Nitrospirota bacterium]
MPGVGFYLNQKLLNAVKSRAKKEKVTVSKIISEALESYLSVKERKSAKEKLFRLIIEKHPLGGKEGWDKLHKERTMADENRN